MPAAAVPAGRARRPTFRTSATVMAAAGYTRRSTRASGTASKPATATTWVPSDVGQYGFTRWNPPDAGANQDISEAGGGNTDNDGRFMNSIGDARRRRRGRDRST